LVIFIFLFVCERSCFSPLLGELVPEADGNRLSGLHGDVLSSLVVMIDLDALGAGLGYVHNGGLDLAAETPVLAAVFKIAVLDLGAFSLDAVEENPAPVGVVLGPLTYEIDPEGALCGSEA
jgi:hypothetical protein